MSSHVKFVFFAAVIVMSMFTGVRADRIDSHRATPIIDRLTKEKPLQLAPTELGTLALPQSDDVESRSGSFVLSGKALGGSGKSPGALSVDRHRDDADRMRLPAFVVSIPEPMTIVLMATGLLGLGAALRKRV